MKCTVPDHVNMILKFIVTVKGCLTLIFMVMWSFLSFQIDIYGFYIHLIGVRTLNHLRANHLTLNQYQLITQAFNHAEILLPAKYNHADI